MKILLYGGTFDPPHNGHKNNLRAALERVRPDRAIVMPGGHAAPQTRQRHPGGTAFADVPVL